MTTPAWVAPASGLPGDLDATNSASGINQFLGAHGVVPVYQGAQIVTPGGAQNFLWTAYGNSKDLSQPFTMSGTALSRVTIPLQPNGNGANVLVSLYADSGGSPNIAAGAICSTMLPAQYLNQVCAPNGLTSAGVLASPRDNTGYLTGGVTTTAYIFPSAGVGGISRAVAATASGNYILAVGGTDSSNNNCVASVNSLQYAGAGVLAAPIPQPSLPIGTANPAVAVVNGYLVVAGGITGSTGSPTFATAVWVAGWNSSTGVVGSWSSQPVLPQAVQLASGVGYGSSVYVVGGRTGPSVATVVSSVYYASVTNGQIQAWNTAPPLPTALQQCLVAAVNGWLIVMGGTNSAGNPVSTVYYAKINADGSLQNWQTGPSLPTPVQGFSEGFDLAVADDLLVIIAGNSTGGIATNAIQVLPVTATTGLGSTWQTYTWSTVESIPAFAFGNGDGTYDIIGLDLNAVPPQYLYSKLLSVPCVSVPLPATGLTNGGTYHVVLRQFSNSSASDYVAFGTLDGTPLPAAALTHGRYASGAWTSVGAGRSVPMSAFDQTTGGPVLHTWEDASMLDMAGSAARWSSLLYNSQGLLFGASEMTLQPNVPLNSNPTFTSGVSPWTASNGTLTQSSAQVHGGYPFSGLLTPTGGFTQAYAQSELFPVTQTPWGAAQWVMAMGWFYSPTGWSNFSLSVNWYDQSKAYISTSSATVSLTAATWTQVNNWFQPPAAAAYAQLAPTEGGTPGATNLLYMSNVFLVLTPETVGAQTSAATVNYPSGAYWAPTGVTQLN